LVQKAFLKFVYELKKSLELDEKMIASSSTTSSVATGRPMTTATKMLTTALDGWTWVQQDVKSKALASIWNRCTDAHRNAANLHFSPRQPKLQQMKLGWSHHQKLATGNAMR
jgi:hypothetical protein